MPNGGLFKPGSDLFYGASGIARDGFILERSDVRAAFPIRAMGPQPRKPFLDKALIERAWNPSLPVWQKGPKGGQDPTWVPGHMEKGAPLLQPRSHGRLSGAQIAEIWIEEVGLQDRPSAPAQDFEHSGNVPIMGLPSREEHVHGEVEGVQCLHGTLPRLKCCKLAANQINGQVGA